ncbi:MAG: paraquat-inducible protein A [Pikeienuella sp.]
MSQGARDPDGPSAAGAGWLYSPRGFASLALLGLWPVAWTAPLASAGLLPFFGGQELSVLGAIARLWAADLALAMLVALLGVVIPYAKTLASLAAQAGRLPAWAGPLLPWLAKLSMADVFLIALYVVVAKGVGIGYVTPAWGLWLFTFCVLVSIWASGGRG